MLRYLLIRFFQMAAAIGLALPLAAVAGGNNIVIGQVIDLSGPNGGNGRDYVAGIKTYFDSINASGGLQGRRLELVVHDDQGIPDQAARLADKLIDQEQVDYLFGGIGEEACTAIMNTAAFKRSRHILFAPLSCAEQAPSSRVLFWRPGYDKEIEYLFTHFSRLGTNSFAVVYQDTAASQQALRKLQARASQSTTKLTGSLKIGSNSTLSEKEVARFAATRPGFVLVIADTLNTALFLKEFRKHDAQGFVAGTSLVNLQTLRELAGNKAVEWTVFSQVVPDPAASASVLQLEHLKMLRKFRDEPASSLTLEGFAAAKTLVAAIRQAKPGSRTVLADLQTRRTEIELGGMRIGFSGEGSALSSHLDIALLSNARLKF